MDGSTATLNGLIAQIAQASVQQPIGRIDSLSGNASITRVDGTIAPAQKGTPVYQGDTVETAADGKVGIIFADNTTFALGQNGQMQLDELVYNPSSKSGSIGLSMLKGAFVLVTGEIAPSSTDAMTIRTPVGTIGIRGTKIAGMLGDQGELNINLLPDPVGRPAAVVVSNAAGTQFLTAANTGLTVASYNSAPGTPGPMQSGALQSVLGQVISFLDSLISGQITEALQQTAQAQQGERNAVVQSLSGKGDGTTTDKDIAPTDDGKGAPLKISVTTENNDTLASVGRAEESFSASFQYSGVGYGYGGNTPSTLITAPLTPEKQPAPIPVPSPVVSPVLPPAPVPVPDPGHTIIGGDSGVVLRGSDGDDLIIGGSGNDSIFADLGDDLIYGGAGTDIISYENLGTALVSLSSLVSSSVATGGIHAVIAGNRWDISGVGGQDTIFDAEVLVGSRGYDSVDITTSGLTLSFSNIEVIGGSHGADTINILGSQGAYVNGHGGEDMILGGEGSDMIIVDGGDDTVNGRGGDDLIYVEGNLNNAGIVSAGDGDDLVFINGTIAGGAILDGGAGSDTLAFKINPSQSATLTGFASNFEVLLADITGFEEDQDIYFDSSLFDSGIHTVILSGSTTNGVRIRPTSSSYDRGIAILGQGYDGSAGLAGDDTISGSLGHDTIMSGAGNDYLAGRGGQDYIDGGAGNDTIIGGSDSDTLIGDAGNDLLSGGGGWDQLQGGEGNDTIILDPGSNGSTAYGGEGDDVIEITGGWAQLADTYLFGNEGNDTLLLSGIGESATMSSGLLYDIETIQIGAGLGQLSYLRFEGERFENDVRFAITSGDRLKLYAADTSHNLLIDMNNNVGGTDGFFIHVSTGSGNDTILATNIGYFDEGASTPPSLSINTGGGSDIVLLGSLIDYEPDSLQINLGSGNDWLILQDPYSLNNLNLDFGADNDVLSLIYNSSGNVHHILSPSDASGLEKLELVFNNNAVTGANITVSGSLFDSSGCFTINGYGTAGASNYYENSGSTGYGNLAYGLPYGAVTSNVRIDASDLSPTQHLQISGDFAGDDTMLGGYGADTLFGGSGHDSLVGNDGDDFLYAGSGNDVIDGGAGDDFIYGAAGQDTFNNAGQGNDTYYYYAPNEGNDHFIGINAATKLKFVSSNFGNISSVDSTNFFTGSGSTFTGETGSSSSACFVLFNESGVNKLYFDSNGNGAGGYSLIATFNGGDTITENNLMMVA
jgi:Ca2+-binding RTX toxin-like protein